MEHNCVVFVRSFVVVVDKEHAVMELDCELARKQVVDEDEVENMGAYVCREFGHIDRINISHVTSTMKVCDSCRVYRI